MFSPQRMKHVTLRVLTEDLPVVSLSLAELGLFCPDPRLEAEDELPENPGKRYRELYLQAKARMDKIQTHLDFGPTTTALEHRPIDETVLAQTNGFLGEAWQACSNHEEELRAIFDERREIEQLERTLSNFQQLKVDLGLLQEERRFLDIHIGTVPQEHTRQLRDALRMDGYMLFVYMDSHPNAHVVIIGPGLGQTSHLRSVLDTAGFRALEIPPELHTQPDEAAEHLIKRREAATQREAILQERFIAWRNRVETELRQAAETLILAAPYVALGEVARNRGALSQVHGWAPEADIPLIDKTLEEKLQHPFVLQTRDPRPDERNLVPSLLRHNPLLKPFAFLVSQYGVPRYGEINPTLIFALTFVCMFGMMFGDVGHGATIMAASWLARRRLSSFTTFALSAGAASVLFGFLYGSVFGYEHILPAIWLPPLSDPIYMLSAALLWGMGFILLTSLLNIANHLLLGDYDGALFAPNGLFSLALYIGLIGSGISRYLTGTSGTVWPLLAMLALTGLFFHQLRSQQNPPAERVLVALIETFETVIGYVANTLSFLRVAAFSLNHVALALAVFTIANMLGELGHGLMIVLGNLFILVLEGAIVIIQVLRLEYYEGFTRFYAGDGQAFRPLRL